MLSLKKKVLGAALAAWLWPAAASAQDCTRTELDTSSSEYSVAATMAGRYMRLTSAASYAERRLLKGLEAAKADHDGGRFVFGVRWDWLWGVGRAPVRLSGNGCPLYGRVPFDMYSANFGMAGSYGPVHFYYASSVATAAAQSDIGRIAGSMFTPIAGNIYSVIAPFTGSSSGTLKGIIYSFDYIAGAGVNTKYINASAGYVGSQGFFGRVSQVDLKLFASAAVRTLTPELAYLRGGLDYLKFAKDNVTSFSGYFRQLKQSPPERLLNAAEGEFEEAKSLRGFAFRTLHLEQVDLYKHLDLMGAYGLPPFNNLHQLDLRVHTAAYSVAGPVKNALDSGGIALAAGIVRVPEQRLLGQAGKPLVHVSLDVMFLKGMGRLSLHFNDPEILSMYPTAANSLNATFEVLGTPGSGG